GPHVLDPVLVVRDAHGPAEDGRRGAGVQVGHGRDRGAIDAGGAFDRLPGKRPYTIAKVGEAFRSLLDEGGIDSVGGETPPNPCSVGGGTPPNPRLPAFEEQFGDPAQERDVAADVRLDVEAGDVRAEQERAHVGGHAEVDEPELLDRVDDDDLTAAAA